MRALKFKMISVYSIDSDYNDLLWNFQDSKHISRDYRMQEVKNKGIRQWNMIFFSNHSFGIPYSLWWNISHLIKNGEGLKSILFVICKIINNWSDFWFQKNRYYPHFVIRLAVCMSVCSLTQLPPNLKSDCPWIFSLNR